MCEKVQLQGPEFWKQLFSFESVGCFRELWFDPYPDVKHVLILSMFSFNRIIW